MLDQWTRRVTLEERHRDGFAAPRSGGSVKGARLVVESSWEPPEA